MVQAIMAHNLQFKELKLTMSDYGIYPILMRACASNRIWNQNCVHILYCITWLNCGKAYFGKPAANVQHIVDPCPFFSPGNPVHVRFHCRFHCRVKSCYYEHHINELQKFPSDCLSFNVKIFQYHKLRNTKLFRIMIFIQFPCHVNASVLQINIP